MYRIWCVEKARAVATVGIGPSGRAPADDPLCTSTPLLARHLYAGDCGVLSGGPPRYHAGVIPRARHGSVLSRSTPHAGECSLGFYVASSVTLSDDLRSTAAPHECRRSRPRARGLSARDATPLHWRDRFCSSLDRPVTPMVFESPGKVFAVGWRMRYLPHGLAAITSATQLPIELHPPVTTLLFGFLPP